TRFSRDWSSDVCSSDLSNVGDAGLKQKLKDLENQLRASNQKQQEEREQSIRASLNLGSFLCTKLQDDGRFLDFLNHNYELLCKEIGRASCRDRVEMWVV